MTEQDAFDAFWSAYPKKTGKIAARKQWHTRWPSLSQDVPGVLAAVERQKQSRAWQKGYILDPERWIKRGHDQDEPEDEPEEQPEWVRRRVGPTGWRPRVTCREDLDLEEFGDPEQPPF